MKLPKLTKFELTIMEALWSRGSCSIREIHESFKDADKPAYTTVQTTVYRLENKQALKCVKRISNANVFEAMVSRDEAQRRLIDDLLGLFGGEGRLVMARLVETGKLTLAHVKEAEQTLRRVARKDRSK